MKTWQRVLFVLVLLAVDLAVFFVPLTALVLAFAILFRPQWFLRLTKRIYGVE